MLVISFLSRGIGIYFNDFDLVCFPYPIEIFHNGKILLPFPLSCFHKLSLRLRRLLTSHASTLYHCFGLKHEMSPVEVRVFFLYLFATYTPIDCSYSYWGQLLSLSLNRRLVCDFCLSD